MLRNCNCALVAIGGNLAGHMDSPYAQVNAAIDQISQAGLHVSRRSRLYLTPCFPKGAGPDFVNAAVACVTTRAPSEVLALLHEVEQAAGRSRHKRWEARVIDLDLLAYDDRVLPDLAGYRAWESLPVDQQMICTPGEVILPHPRLQERAFVIVPLNDVAPDWRHPVSGLTVAEMYAALPQHEIDEIRPISQ